MRTLDRLWKKKRFFFFLFDGVLITSVAFLALHQSLEDYEQLCREVDDPKKKEELALEAVEFLIRQTIPDSIAHQVQQEVANENLRPPTDTLLFPEISPIADDSVAGFYDGLLTNHLPKLYWMRRNQADSIRSENFFAGRKIAAQVDSYMNYSYWVPLMEFLEKANDGAWRSWRSAAMAANLSRRYTQESRFELAKLAAIHGLRLNRHTPDRRLQLELYLRLQNALVEGRASAFHIGFALADWITRESDSAGYRLRVVSMRFNWGNQLFLFGRRDEALEKLENTLRSAQQWRHFQPQHMQWYISESTERITAVLYELGNYSTMRQYLDHYGKLATTTRQKTLYHLNSGLAARLAGDLQTAEEEFQAAIVCGKGDEKKDIEPDPLNVWYAYLELGQLYLEYHLPEKGLFYFQTAKAYGDGLDDFLNMERLTDYWLHVAQACAQKQDMPSAKMALEQARKQLVDSPVLRAKSLMSAARIHENLGQVQEATAMLTQARAICKKFGMTIHEINAILQQAALSFKTQKNSKGSAYPVEELEDLIGLAEKSGDEQQLVNSLALAVEAAIHAGRYDQAKPYADWLWRETEALSRLYDQEQRLIFFQHSTYENVKAAVNLDIRQRNIEAAFAKLDYLKARALRRRLAGSPAAISMDSQLPNLDLNKLQSQLRADEAIVDYMVAADTLYAFVLTPSELQIFSSAVKRHELRTIVLEYLVQLTSDDRRGNGYNEQRLRQEFAKAIQLSHSLYTKLLAGMAKELEKIDRLYIVPDEFLHALPFSTLALQADAEPEFLINHKAIMYLPAASLFSNGEESGVEKFTQSCLLASVDKAMYGARQIFAFLDGLGKDKVALKMDWENQAELKNTLAARYQSYFFYAHAEANWDDPWQSYIQFPLQAPRQYGKLAYADVDSIDWRGAELVILAGCETTGNRIYSGAGLSGLQRGFLGGGSRQVLATFWKVDAAQVVWQMSQFLGEWNRHGDAVLALQKVQQASIAKLKADPYMNNCPHPRYWGAYNLIGTKAAWYSPP